MKKVKYIWHNWGGIGLTTGKVYDVVRYNVHPDQNNIIELIDDNNEIKQCRHKNRDGSLIYFIDVSKEYRDEVIDEILR